MVRVNSIKINKGSGKGWHKETVRHHRAKKYGRAGEVYHKRDKSVGLSNVKVGKVKTQKRRIKTKKSTPPKPLSKSFPVHSNRTTVFFDGSGNVVAQYYKENGKTYKLPSVSPIRQRETIYTKESMQHPAKMYTPLVQKVIQDHTEPGDIILDPMGGIGTTGVEASRLGRHAIIVDYEPRFVNMSKKNIELLKKSGQQRGNVKVYRGDARNLSFVKNKVDTVVTSPPFENVEPFQDKNFKIKGKQVSKGGSGSSYSKNKKDKKQLGNLKGETYLSEMIFVYKECYNVLKPKGKMILHTKNFRRKGKIVRLDKDTIALAESAGFKLQSRHKRKIENPSFWIRNYRKKHPDAPQVNHEDILVFTK